MKSQTSQNGFARFLRNCFIGLLSLGTIATATTLYGAAAAPTEGDWNIGADQTHLVGWAQITGSQENFTYNGSTTWDDLDFSEALKPIIPTTETANYSYEWKAGEITDIASFTNGTAFNTDVINAGTYTVKISGSSDHFDFEPTLVSFTVDQKELTVAYADATGTATYGTLATIPTPEISGLVAGDDVSVTVTTPTTAYDQYSDVGTYTWTANTILTGAKASNYTASLGANQTYTLTVGKKAVTVAYADATGSATYGTEATIPAPFVTGAVNDDVLTATGTATTGTYGQFADVGNYVWTANTTLEGDKSGNYTATLGTNSTYTLTVGALGVTVAYATPTGTETYGTFATIPAPVVTGAVNGDVLTATGTATTGAYSEFADVGDYVWTADATLGGTKAGNYTATVSGNTTYTLTVGKKAVTVAYATTAGNETYGTLATIPTPVVTGVVNSDDVVATVTPASTYSQFANVGDYVWTATGAITGAKSGNYTATLGTNQTYTLTVGTLGVTVAYENATGTSIYGTSATIPTPVVTGAVNGDVLTATGTATTGTYGQFADVGNYVWTADATLGGTKAGNYTATVSGNTTYTLTVNQATLVVKTAPSSKGVALGTMLGDVTIDNAVVATTDNGDAVIPGVWAWKNSSYSLVEAATEPVSFTPTASADNFIDATVESTVSITITGAVTPTNKMLYVSEAGTGNGSAANSACSFASARLYIEVATNAVDTVVVVGSITSAINATVWNVDLVGSPVDNKPAKIGDLTTSKPVIGLVITGTGTFAAGADLLKCTVVGDVSGTAKATATVFFAGTDKIQTTNDINMSKCAVTDEANKGSFDGNVLKISSSNNGVFGPKFDADWKLTAGSVLINRGK